MEFKKAIFHLIHDKPLIRKEISIMLSLPILGAASHIKTPTMVGYEAILII